MLSACASSGPTISSTGEADPLEAQNRRVHEFNRGIDRALLRPASQGYVSAVPDEIAQSVSNFAGNISLPGVIVNNLFQGDLESAGVNTFRFALNTTLGLVGLFDPAGDFGIYERDTDFGETLHVWGVGEGDYLVLPFLGPSTTRDAVGTVVDFFTNPLTARLPEPEKYYGTAARIAKQVGDRGRYSETIDSVLYDSADGYAQTRSFYLQNRRYELGGGGADAYVDPYNDPYSDPYDDPYAE